MNAWFLDLSRLDTRNVKDFSHMFESCSMSQINVSNFKTGNAENMAYMFKGCESVEVLNTNKVTQEMKESKSIDAVIDEDVKDAEIEEKDEN